MPNQTAEQVSEITGVETDCVLRLLAAGRIANLTPAEAVRCGRCGEPAISFTKRLCQKCLTEMNVELATAQSKIQLPPKRQVGTDSTRSVKDVVDQKRKF